MKIAYVVDRFPAISETFVLAQIIGMIDRGHEVRVFARRGASAKVVHDLVDRYQLCDVTTYTATPPASLKERFRLAMEIIRNAWRAGHLANVARALNVFRYGRAAMSLRLLISAAPFFDHQDLDVVHCQFGNLATELWRLRQCGALQGVLLTSFRGTDVMKEAARDPARFSRLFSDGEKFLAVSCAVRDKLIEVGCPESKIEVLRSGINLERFRMRPFEPVHDPLRVISVGRLAPNKGIEYCIRAIGALKARGARVEYRILGVGPNRQSLESLVDQLQLSDVVFLEGAKTSAQVVEILRESDVLVTPSITGPNGEQEGLPNAPKEAMAIGVPVIATAIGGIPELVRDGDTGYLVAEQDPEAIAEAILHVRDAGDETKHVISAARALVSEEFEIGMLNDRLEATYQDLVAA